ncbi:ribosomal L7Ae/L30e/S12e/Gadd45 family protein [Paenibacillus sp. NPDC058071]|uniref:ribosomal L7Ae/L30e/S12e/Gadd45 family protein n=1 Tax=Paenibacillus sp. NPDC058071 TaxID=3346326 RepID=UPI0036D8B782
MQFKVGAKETTRMLELRRAVEVYIARDADSRMKDKIVHLCEQAGVPVKWVETKAILGETCGIEVAAATAALVSERE